MDFTISGHLSSDLVPEAIVGAKLINSPYSPTSRDIKEGEELIAAYSTYSE